MRCLSLKSLLQHASKLKGTIVKIDNFRSIHASCFSFQEGVYIYGLSLDGASWDRRNARLVDPQPKVLFTTLPVVHMYAIQAQAQDPRLYACPVYKKPMRTDLNYITFIVLRTVQNPDFWTLRGVAALCDIK